MFFIEKCFPGVTGDDVVYFLLLFIHLMLSSNELYCFRSAWVQIPPKRSYIDCRVLFWIRTFASIASFPCICMYDKYL